MAGAMLAYQRLSEGTPSGGSWELTLPLSNAKLPRLSAKAQTTDATLASCIANYDYGAAVSLQVFALVRSNLQANAKWRIRGSNNADMSSPQYDSGWLDCWPVMWATGVLQPSHPNYTDRLFTNEDIATYQLPIVHVAPAAHSARYWRIEFDDTTNTDGCVKLPFLVMAPAYQPGGAGTATNFGVGASLAVGTTSTADRALSGFRQAQDRGTWLSTPLVFPTLSLEEAVSVFQPMQRRLGLSKYVFLVFDPEDAELLPWRSFLAQQEEIPEVTLIQWGEQHCAIKLAEVR